MSPPDEDSVETPARENVVPGRWKLRPKFFLTLLIILVWVYIAAVSWRMYQDNLRRRHISQLITEVGPNDPDLEETDG